MSRRRIQHEDGTGNTMSERKTLFQAIDTGDVSTLKRLLNNNVNLNKRNRQGATALRYAAIRNNLKCLKCLVQHGVRLNTRDSFRKTALMRAVQEGGLESVQALVKMGARVDLKSRGGKSALIFACQRGHFEMVRCLVEAGANVNTVTGNGLTPLVVAIDSGNSKIVKYLVEKDAKDISRKKRCLDTPLTKACRESKTDIMKILVSSGFDLNRSVNRGGTALICAAKIGNLDMVKTLVKSGANLETFYRNENALMWASDMGHAYVCEYLIKSGADINAMNKFNSTVLMMAARGGNAPIIHMLLGAGCNVNLQDLKGQTALFYAVRQGHFNVVKAILQAGAILTHVSNGQETVLHVAAANGHPRLMQTLLRASGYPLPISNFDEELEENADAWLEINYDKRLNRTIDLNFQNEEGKTALFQAALKFNEENVKMLLKAGADPNVKTYDGESALEVALRTWVYITECRQRYIIPPLTTIDHLLKGGACVGSLLGFLIAKKQHELVKKMISHGALPTLEYMIQSSEHTYNPKRFTPFSLALCVGNIGCAAYFAQNLFLHKFDMTNLNNHPNHENPGFFVCERNIGYSAELLGRIKSQPWTLASLSFMAVSIALGFGSDRAGRVADTMLPATIQTKLMFHDLTNEPVDEWSHITFQSIHDRVN